MRAGTRRVAAALVAAAASVVLIAPPAHADQVREMEYWLHEYGITQAWNTTRGAGVTIAVIDSGIDSSHPDLAGAVVGGADFSGFGAPDGQRPVGSGGGRAHATMVASLAAGRGSAPGVGVIGVAPQASLLSISVGFGEGTRNSDDQIADAVRWAADNGADVINMSLTRNTLDWPTSWDDAFLYAMERDVVIVAAAGNRGSGTVEVGAPATMPGVLTVAGLSRSGTASFDASSQGITIGVAAPAEDLVGAAPDGSHVTWQGSSGATPIVAGVVALVMAAHPELSAGAVIDRITQTARDAGAPGPDPLYGNGILDAAAAVRGTVESSGVEPAEQLREWIRLHRRAPVEEEPATTPQPVVPAPEVEPAPVPQARGPVGELLPTVNELRLVGIPLLVLGGFSAAAIALGVGAARHVRRQRAGE
ncbi:S8 family peptidase [Ruicaihuangia caeni]|uniref:S8 family peptidase n=1 Tax=Ruicaihuangia caeni TaxID=3042517 RepID=UPI00338EAC62